jgi:drug/metabolite transporter (DMT)-like permease
MFPMPSSLASRKSHIPRAAFLMLGSLFLYTLQDAIIKSLPVDYSAIEIIFFRSLFSLVPIGLLSLFEGGFKTSPRQLMQTQHFKAHFLRALIMFLSLVVYIIACRVLDLATLYTLTYSSPLFMSLLAVPLLHEKLGFRRLFAVALGFLGVLIVLRPGTAVFNPIALFAVLSGLLTGLSIVLGRRLTIDSNTLIVLMYSGVCLLFSALLLPFFWLMPDGASLVKFIAIGVTGGLAQYGFTQAFRLAPITAIAPFDYASLLWGILFGYLLWQDIPDLYTLLGSALIISTGLFTILREHHLKQRQLIKATNAQEHA